MSDKLRIILGPTRWQHECKSHGDWRSFHNGITFCPTCGMDKDGLMAEPPIPFDGSVILRRAGATPPASHDAGEADGKLWSFLHDSLHEAHKKLNATGGGEVYYAALDSIAAKLEKDVYIRFIATLTAELAEARALKQEIESDYQRVCERLAAMEEQRDSLRDECERLREAALATAGMYGRDCRESMLRAFEQAVALSAGDTK